ncbi:Forkhead box protein J3, partial [Rhizophlyctis rosea]
MPPLRRHGPDLHIDISYTKSFVTSPPTSPILSADTPSVETPISAPIPASYNPARRRSSTFVKFDPLDPDFTLETHILTKPQYPYSTMIAFAIKTSPQQMLTLNEIYVWFEENYPYFKTAPPGWKNSIRHNLSLNPGFVKTARPVHEPGKGSYWALDIQKLSEGFKQKKIRKPYDNESSPTKSRRGSTKLYPSPPSSAHPGCEYLHSSHSQSFANLYGSLPDLRSPIDIYDSSPRFFDLATADSNDTIAFQEDVEME